MTRFRLGIILALLAVLGGGLAFRFLSREPESPYEFVSVQQGTLVERVLATGSVKKADEVALAFVASGRISVVAVKAGDHVDAERELARLETASLSAQVRNAEAAFTTAQANLAKIEAGASTQDIAVAQASVQSAETALQNAKDAAAKALEKEYLDAFNTIQGIRAAADSAIQTLDAYFMPCGTGQCWESWGSFYTSLEAVRSAESQKPPADAARDRIRATVEGVPSAAAFTSVDAALTSLKSDLAIVRAGAQATYDALQAAADKTAVLTVLTDLDTKLAAIRNDEQAVISARSSNDASTLSAEAALATAQAQLALKQAAARDVDLNPLRAQVDQARATLEAARVALDNAILRAPVSGTITKVNIRKGEVASVSLSALVLLPDAPFTLEAKVPEADIARISIGDSLALTLDAIPDIEFHGTIIHIDPAQEEVGGVITYRITASMDDSDDRVRQGMTANLDIETERRENALFVPQRAVMEEGGKRYVRILRDGAVERVEVTIGIRSADGMLEIVSGLREGEEIISFVRERS
ncbi:MAG: efflux RND transporter periplasmic adaptor subunit [Candidatus Terrybacteria bacterium]|nr:efflux RND transporter periplasmic adaptor subunit [Candidatus Terrybacteria bacterium]